jgi:hypothetical protein
MIFEKAMMQARVLFMPKLSRQHELQSIFVRDLDSNRL